MNQEKLNHIIHNPEQITADDARELEELTKKFPYFSVPYTLLARYYSQNNDYRFEETLHRTALRVNDRNWLYSFLHPEVESETTEIAEAPADLVTDSGIETVETEIIAEPEISEIEEPVVTETRIEPAADIEVEAGQIDVEVLPETDVEVTETQEQVNETEEISAVPEAETENVEENIAEDVEEEDWVVSGSMFEIDTVETETAEHEVFEEIDSFEAGINEQENAGTEELSDIPELNLSSMIVPDTGDGAEENTTAASEFEEEITPVEADEEEPETADETPAEHPTVVKKQATFSPSAVYNIEDYYPSGETNNTAPSDFFTWLSHPDYKEGAKNTEPEAPAEDKQDKKALIDKFIKNPAGVSRPKSEFFHAPEVAKKSDAFPPGLATETLANVFRGQENYSGAIKIYEALMLKNPEKSAYFAALIQKIKDEHKL